MDSVNESEIHSLIEYFSKTMYRARYADETAKSVLEKCIEMAKLDYNVTVVDNATGELCAHYPSHIIVMESEKNVSGDLIKDTIYEGTDSQKLRELFTKARTARCRTRFPVPVIFYQGRFVCRSSTLSGSPEIYGRSGFDYFFAGEAANDEPAEEDNDQTICINSWDFCDQVRKEDIKLLRSLNVGTIADFMVEKKKVKFGMNVTSSEKVDKENRYAQFTILSLPYPGCEFFKEFRDENYTAENLYFNWSQTHVDAEIIVPQDSVSERIPIKWTDYKNWNLVKLTGNYLLLLLHHTRDSSSGLLVHCISGWDRTPLFVSLLRISLWAEGKIHKSLTPIQLLYFTIAYDWLLFGHNLQDRKSKGEDIFYFCFHFLKYVSADEYSSLKCKGKVIATNSPVSQADERMQCDSGDTDAGELNNSSQGSNHSLNSSWSSISSKSQEMGPLTQAEDLNISGGVDLGEVCQPSRLSDSQQSSSSSNSNGSTITDGSSDSQKLPVAKRSKVGSTSPVAVPSRTSVRQRNDSSSSLSTGSWQYVSSTGSLRSNASGSIVSPSNSRSPVPEGGSDSAATATQENCDKTDFKPKQIDHSQCGSSSGCVVRLERLEKIRKLFFNCYCQSIGHTLKDGSDISSITSIIGTLGGKLSSGQNS